MNAYNTIVGSRFFGRVGSVFAPCALMGAGALGPGLFLSSPRVFRAISNTARIMSTNRWYSRNSRYPSTYAAVNISSETTTPIAATPSTAAASSRAAS